MINYFVQSNSFYIINSKFELKNTIIFRAISIEQAPFSSNFATIPQ